ncbi:MAG: porin, partial [Flavobacteriaceae bacterium]
MKNTILVLTLLMTSLLFSQNENIEVTTPQTNGAENLLNTKLKKGLTIGGYGQIDYNQKESDNGKLDVHRLVMLLGYKFSDKVQFVSEIEYEHVKEVYVEQAFLNYAVKDNFNLKAGLMLVPMGIVNEYHEPTTFNGVERPSMDKSIVPTTWREIGIGVSGRVDDANLKYQAYIFNGFSSI